MAGAGERSGGEAQREGLLLALLALVVLAYWALQYQPFLLPNNDYASFERAARSLAAFELPQSYQRMPIFPALMAALAPLMPEPHPYLHAALVWNLAFGLGTLLLLYRLAARTLGAGAFLVPLAFASATQLHTAALQPLVEPSLAFFVVLAFVLLQARSPWQWVAAGAAALSRYEAAMLIPVLFLVNWRHEGRFWLQVACAALATSGLLLWAGLGALSGSGGSTYLDLMSGMGFTPAVDFFERSVKEPFRGWYRTPWGAGFWIFALVVGGAVATGVHTGWLRFRRETAALLGFWTACVLVIVTFGINKARYVYPTEWILLFFFAAGLVAALPAASGALAARVRGPAAGVAALAAAALLALTLWRWVPRIANEPAPVPAGYDLAYAAALLALGAAWLAASARKPRAAWWTAGLVALVAFAPVVGGGLQAKRAEHWKIHYANYEAALAARWLDANLPAGERVLALPRSHIDHLSGLDAEQLVAYAQLDATDLAGMRSEMRERDIRWAAYTWRKPLQTPSDEYYDRKLKAYLSREFQGGGPLAGFEHVATLAVPTELERDAVQIYRLADDGAR